jgi:hypothetical protein
MHRNHVTINQYYKQTNTHSSYGCLLQFDVIMPRRKETAEEKTKKKYHDVALKYYTILHSYGHSSNNFLYKENSAVYQRLQRYEKQLKQLESSPYITNEYKGAIEEEVIKSIEDVSSVEEEYKSDEEEAMDETIEACKNGNGDDFFDYSGGVEPQQEDIHHHSIMDRSIDELEEKIYGYEMQLIYLFREHGNRAEIERKKNEARNMIEKKLFIEVLNNIDKINRHMVQLNIQLQQERQNQEQQQVEVIQSCTNCMRKQSSYLVEKYGEESSYYLHLNHYSNEHLSTGPRKFKNIQVSSRDNLIYCLCSECYSHLSNTANAAEYNAPSKTWPSFIWKNLLSNQELHQVYEDNIWSYIPLEWRYWWIDSVIEEFPTVYHNITLNNPKPYFDDRTEDLIHWNDEISTYNLPRLAKVCNELLLPTVSCPWGCSEFLHRSGTFPLDICIQRYLQQVLLSSFCTIKPAPKDIIHMITSSRDDYLRIDHDDDTILLNPKWKVRPTIIIDNEKGPYILTCRDHDGGSKLHFIHTCRQPKHILPPPFPDQLCHACVGSRAVRIMRVAKYCTSYYMYNQVGTFNGIGTLNLTTFHNFNTCSILNR